MEQPSGSYLYKYPAMAETRCIFMNSCACVCFFWGFDDVLRSSVMQGPYALRRPLTLLQCTRAAFLWVLSPMHR